MCEDGADSFQAVRAGQLRREGGQTHFKQYERADFAVKAVTIVDLAHRWPKLLARLLEADQAKKKETKKRNFSER